ncbi:hypothetical protein Leryth_025835 [Lithospermum erythrorhizon]|nr:hypothetical protein Leryth_025835 [Lithospermum erythrorhizon]
MQLTSETNTGATRVVGRQTNGNFLGAAFLVTPFTIDLQNVWQQERIINLRGLMAENHNFGKRFATTYSLLAGSTKHLAEVDVWREQIQQPSQPQMISMTFFAAAVYRRHCYCQLSYSGLIGLEGCPQERKLFLWLPVKDIIVFDPSSGVILFDIGVAHKQMSMSQFEDPPICKPQGVLKMKTNEVSMKEFPQPNFKM